MFYGIDMCIYRSDEITQQQPVPLMTTSNAVTTPESVPAMAMSFIPQYQQFVYPSLPSPPSPITQMPSSFATNMTLPPHQRRSAFTPVIPACTR